jgi:hypothetical protein
MIERAILIDRDLPAATLTDTASTGGRRASPAEMLDDDALSRYLIQGTFGLLVPKAQARTCTPLREGDSKLVVPSKAPRHPPQASEFPAG